MDEIKTKQQVVEKIQEAGKILVTVSKDPSVDALSAAIGLTMLFDKQGKYATAIFSGHTPPAIAFLEPEKTFDDTTDSLRDFIIALNKEKADHLRYKVEGDSVKIFITPYKTTITEDDLIFSQGDYNIELVIALGVDNSDDLDAALEDHGKILHDATVITMTAGDQTSELGGVDWHDANSSSLSEMVAGLAEALKDDKKKPLLDGPIATALLTGIVAETERFSNEHTTSKVMTVAASLMAAGADQQLIANELQAATADPAEPEEPEQNEPEHHDDDASSEHTERADESDSLSIKKDDDAALAVDHSGETLADLDKRVRGEEKSQEKVEEELAAISSEAKEEAAKRDAAAIANATPHSVYALPDDAAPTPGIEPTFGGTLNATTEQAAEDTRREVENDQNKTILSHAYLGDTDTQASAPGSVGVNDFAPAETPQAAYAFDEPAKTPAAAVPTSEPAPAEPVPQPAPAEAPSLAFAGEKVIQPLSEVQAQPAPAPEPMPATTPQPVAPAPNPSPADLGLPLPPPLPDFSQGVAPPPAIPLPPTPSPTQPAILGDILAPEAPPAAAPVPTSTPAPAPAEQVPQPVVPAPAFTSAAPAPADPGQFQIPSQYQ